MPEYNGCKRWLVLPGLGTLQPSEIAKFAVVLVFAMSFPSTTTRWARFAVGVLPFALVLGAVAVLMLLEPHLSGTLLILGIGAVLMFVGGTGLKWFVLAGVSGVAAIGAAAWSSCPPLCPTPPDRLNSWLDPFADPLGDGHQTIQSLYAIGSGGAAGLGLGNSRQKHLFVPEPQNDFIFSIVCEELGFVGACAVVGLFVLLLWRGITLAAHAPDRFGALLVVGFTVQVGPGSQKQRAAAAGSGPFVQWHGAFSAGAASCGCGHQRRAFCRVLAARPAGRGSDITVQGVPSTCRLAPEAAARDAGIHFVLRTASGTAWPGGNSAARRVPHWCKAGGPAPFRPCADGRALPGGGARLILTAPAGLHGADITLGFPSVGATETLLLAAAAAQGETVLRGGRTRTGDQRSGSIPEPLRRLRTGRGHQHHPGAGQTNAV